ncbi:MAG: LysR family transcriptional regulator [Rhodobacteraceae bacterium]|nr:LysR family transcriptional regulator [Paracoccaceae bacterium]
MDKWEEMRTAFYVARLGAVSAAAKALGIHRATVNRHIDTLEAALGGKLFQRHARGYSLTEAGRDLLHVAAATEEQFNQLAGRTKGRTMGVSGELIITSMEVVSDTILPALRRFRERHPETSVRYLVSGDVMKLDYGEAHVAIRGGKKPDHPDNVVQPYTTIRTGLYAHQDYVARHGRLKSVSDVGDHAFIASDGNARRVLFRRWMQRKIPQRNIVFRAADTRTERQAIMSGLGIGFYPEHAAQASPDLVEMLAPVQAWDIAFWLVTHVDLHRTAKIQAILKLLKQPHVKPSLMSERGDRRPAPVL